MQDSISFVFFIFILQGRHATASCFFPPEYTGEFVMQKSINTGGTVEYSTINISYIGTPLWGNCSRRSDNNFIFRLSNDDNPCLRCLNLNLKSKNVLQVRSRNFTQCYAKEEDAISSCPSENVKNIDEIILFKIAELLGYPTQKEFCPLSDKYVVSYNTINPSADHCMLREGGLNTCNTAAVMDVRFQHCQGNSSDFKLSCIGQWENFNGQKYLALEDTRKKPAYRCALYRENLENGEIHIALSKDSTCDVQLTSATQGYETLTLTPIVYKEDTKWLDEIESSNCRFPAWLQGEWEHVNVDNNRFYYKDQTDFVNYDLKCLSRINQDKYIVYSRTHCNEKRYNCLWAEQRSDDVFEFQTGGSSSKYKTEHLCDPSNMPSKWITQSRKLPVSPIKCPISGVFKGMIPETKSFCSNLSSDCMTPDLMYYKVFNCDNMQVYEEREYRCLGHWKEDDLLYTYTKRHDKVAEGTFECFVGSIVSDKEDYIIIKEAGEHCQRNMDALVSGMKLIKQKQLTVLCVGNETNSDTNDDKKTDWSIYDTTAQNNQSVLLGNKNDNNVKVSLETGASIAVIPLVTINLLSLAIVIAL